MTKNNTLETPVCNLCGRKDSRIVQKEITYWEYEGKFTIVQCLNCDLVFTSPRPKLSEMEKYYESEMYFGRDVKKNDDIEDGEYREDHYGPMYKIAFRKKKGKVLDIGAGTGLLLSKFKDEGWEVDGVELTGNAVKYAKRKYGIKLKQGDFLKKRIKEKYDVIILNGALEHLHKPLETLTQARNNLKKRGCILISIPNYDSIGRRLFGKNWFAWQPPRHLYHFSPKTVKMMLEKAGYQRITIEHNFRIQNQYIFFQSARYMMSPKFKKKPTGGLSHKSEAFYPKFSLKKEFGKAFFNTVSFVTAWIEPLIKKGEVMIVYAEK